MIIDKARKVIKCTFVDPIDEGNGRKEVLVEYLDRNNVKHIEKGVVFISADNDNQIDLTLNGLYYSETYNAKIVLKNHYNDLIIKEIEKIGYYNDLGWVWKWDKEDCKEIVDKIKKEELMK